MDCALDTAESCIAYADRNICITVHVLISIHLQILLPICLCFCSLVLLFPVSANPFSQCPTAWMAATSSACQHSWTTSTRAT